MLQPNLMLTPYLKTMEIDEICQQCSMIRLMKLINSKLLKLDTFTVKRNPTTDYELSAKIRLMMS